MLHAISKSFVFTVAIIIFLGLFTSAEIKEDYIYKKDFYKYALLEATKDATAVLYERKQEDSMNVSYDGDLDENTEIPVDFNNINTRFYNTLWENLGYSDDVSQGSFKMKIPIKGIIGNQAVYISLWNNTWLPPVAYSYIDSANNRIYNFTLGQKVLVHNLITGTEYWDTIDNLPTIKIGISNTDFKNNVITDIINHSLTKAASSEFNLNAWNDGSGVNFTINATSTTNVVAPGYFALVDGIKIGFLQKRLRLFCFRGSQLIEN